jgi:hypothetical protein
MKAANQNGKRQQKYVGRQSGKESNDLGLKPTSTFKFVEMKLFVL